jgi:hypothetical protein
MLTEENLPFYKQTYLEQKKNIFTHKESRKMTSVNPLYRDVTKFTYTGAGASQSYTTLTPTSNDTKDTLYEQSPIPIVIKPEFQSYYNPNTSFQRRYDSVRIVSPAKFQVNLTASQPKEVAIVKGNEGYAAPTVIGDYATMRGYKLH